jgi:hypothetical protein
MPRKKAEPVDGNETAVKTRTIIRAKTAHSWSELLKTARDSHWRRLQVKIRIRGQLLAGKPAALNAAQAMLKARGLEDQIEAVSEIEDPDLRAKAAEKIARDEGLCEFTRRKGKPGIYIPANNVKAGLKENWSVLGKMNEVRGSRKALAEGVFVYCGNSWEVPSEDRDYIRVGDAPVGVLEAVSHSVGPSGPVHSIKRHEFVENVELTFDIYIAAYSSVEDKISDDDVAEMLIHFGEHGLGACRSQGYGRFDIIEVKELGVTQTTPASETVPSAPAA